MRWIARALVTRYNFLRNWPLRNSQRAANIVHRGSLIHDAMLAGAHVGPRMCDQEIGEGVSQVSW